MTRASSRQRKARKLDRRKVLELHEKGLTTVEIARHQRVAPSTVWRFLELAKPEREAVERFKAQRADVFARLAGKTLNIQEKVLDSLEEEGVINALKPHEKNSLLISLNLTSGTLYDKERLETGKSTSNISTVSRMLDAVAEGLHKPQRADKTKITEAKAVAHPERVRNFPPALAERGECDPLEIGGTGGK